MTANLMVSKQELIKLSSQSFNGMINDINSLSTDENNNVDVRQNQWVILRQIIFPFIYRGLKIKCDLLNSLRNGLLYTIDAYFTEEAINKGIIGPDKSNFGKAYSCIMNNTNDIFNNPKLIFTKINTETNILSYLKTKTSYDADYNTIINELKQAYKYLIQCIINDINETYAKCKVLIDAFENQQYEKFSVIIEKTFDISGINTDNMKCYDYLNFVNIDKIKNVFDISTNMKINDAILNHSTKLFITNPSEVKGEIQYYNTNYITKLENIYNNEEFKKFTKDNLIFDSLLYTSFDNIIKKTKRDCYNTNFATTEDEIFELYNLLLTQFNITGDFRIFIIALHNIADTATIPNQKKLPEIVRDKTGKELDAKIISSLNILNTAVPAYQPMNVMPSTSSSTGGLIVQPNNQHIPKLPQQPNAPPTLQQASQPNAQSPLQEASASTNTNPNSANSDTNINIYPNQVWNGGNSLFLQNLTNKPPQTGGAIDDITSLSLSSSTSLSESTTFDSASIKGGKAFLAKPPDFRLKATATHNSLNNRSDTSSINITNSKNTLSQSLTNTTISGGELNNYFNKLIQTALKNNKLNGGDANTSIELNDDSDYSDSELDDELLGGRRKDDDDPEIIKLKEINHKIMDRIMDFLKVMDPSLEGNELKENAQKYKAILNKHFRSEYSEFKEGVKPTSEEKRKYFEYLDEQITEKVLKKLYNKDEMDELSTSWKSTKSKKSEDTSDSGTLEKSEDSSDSESTTTTKKKSKKTDKSSSKSTSSKKSKKSGGSDELISSDSSDSDTSNQFSETTSSVISSMLTGGRSKKHLNLFNY